ncbi:MAG: hypothetical protein KAR55_07120 [Thermoplasmatales archaeon]|nr:hypothetical protein [Thermoplasmatales archaeon]
MKNKYTVILTIIIFIFGFVLGMIVSENGTLFIINNADSDEIEVSENNVDSIGNISNDEIRYAINFSRHFLNNPEFLNDSCPSVYKKWYEYRLSNCPDEDINILMKNYNDWIISYAFFNVSIDDAEPGILPRESKDTPYENYTLDEVKSAIYYFHPYLNNPYMLQLNKPKTYDLWFDYRTRVCQNSTINTMMKYYNYWIISYAFGI